MAQTQPNFERMQTSVQEMVRGAQNTVREISLISNIPIVNQGNQIQQILIQMQSFQAEMRTDNRRFQEEMRGQINGLRTEIQELRTEINGLRVEMRTGFRDVNNRINVVDHNGQARPFNNAFSQIDAPLSPLVNDLNQPIPNFPRDLRGITALTANTITPLLTACGLETVNLTIDEKKRRFARYIGARYLI